MNAALLSRRELLATGLPAMLSAVFAVDNDDHGKPPARLGVPLYQEPLAFDWNALEPYMDGKTLRTHFEDYHAKQLRDLQKTLDEIELAVSDVVSLMPSIRSLPQPPKTRQSLLQLSLASRAPGSSGPQLLPEDVQNRIRVFGGAHLNHTAFWRFLTPPDKSPTGPMGKAAKAIEDEFGTIQEFKNAFTEAAVNHDGPGWAWLVYRPDGKLVITTTRNEDNPLMKDFVAWQDHGRAVLLLDLWDHSYQARFKNNRRNYIDAWWNVVDWSFVSKAHAIAKSVYGH